MDEKTNIEKGLDKKGRHSNEFRRTSFANKGGSGMKTQNKKCAIEGANETNQSKSNADFGNCQESAIPKIKELVGLLGRMEELREELDILSVRGDCHSVEVHVSSDSFPDLFSFGEYDTKRFAEYGRDEYRAVVGGVKFFCLVDKEVQDESL